MRSGTLLKLCLNRKKPKNLQNKDHNPQTICEHLAASYLNQTMVWFLTDLNRSWTFYWYAKNRTKEAQGSYKLKLENEGEPARLAKYILKASTMSHAGKLFQLLCRPISFQAVADKLIEEHDSKRARRDFGGDGGSSNPGWKASRMGHQPPPSGPGSNSSSGMEFQNNDNAGDGNRTMDMARALSICTPLQQ
jgi:hypothetical protein